MATNILQDWGTYLNRLGLNPDAMMGFRTLLGAHRRGSELLRGRLGERDELLGGAREQARLAHDALAGGLRGAHGAIYGPRGGASLFAGAMGDMADVRRRTRGRMGDAAADAMIGEAQQRSAEGRRTHGTGDTFSAAMGAARGARRGRARARRGYERATEAPVVEADQVAGLMQHGQYNLRRSELAGRFLADQGKLGSDAHRAAQRMYETAAYDQVTPPEMSDLDVQRWFGQMLMDRALTHRPEAPPQTPSGRQLYDFSDPYWDSPQNVQREIRELEQRIRSARDEGRSDLVQRWQQELAELRRQRGGQEGGEGGGSIDPAELRWFQNQIALARERGDQARVRRLQRQLAQRRRGQ